MSRQIAHPKAGVPFAIRAKWATYSGLSILLLLAFAVAEVRAEGRRTQHRSNPAPRISTHSTRPLGPVRQVQLTTEDLKADDGLEETTEPAAPQAIPPVAGSRLVRKSESGFPSSNPEAETRAARYILDRVDPELTLDVRLDRPTIIRLKIAPFRDQVADESILEVLNVSETEYSITGKKIGATTLNFWFENPDIPGGRDLISYLVRVTDDQSVLVALLPLLEQDVNRAFPNSAVKLSYAGRQVIVRGQAKDIEDATQILRIVSQSLPQEAIEEFDGNTRVGPDLNPLASYSPDELEQAGGLTGLVKGQTGTGANGNRINNRLVNLLEVGGIHQVMLKVTVAEVNRSALRAIGAKVDFGNASLATFSSLLPLPVTGGTLNVTRDDFDLTIKALKELNLARSLAEPNLVTMNGQQANFHVGGQFPVPQSTLTGGGAQGGVQFVPFGVQLNFTPNVTDHDRIRLNLHATVSTRDETTGSVISGSIVSGLNNRDFQTTVELREGETLAIAGLMQSSLGGSSARVPFLGDLPILGRLFSSDNTSYDEQELIVLVTPYLVNPLAANREPLPLPGSDYFEPDDFEFFLRGSMTGHFAEDFRSPARTDFEQIKAFRSLEQELIIGQPGHSNGLRCPSVSKGSQATGGAQ